MITSYFKERGLELPLLGINKEYGLNELFIGVEAMIGRNGNNIISLLL